MIASITARTRTAWAVWLVIPMVVVSCAGCIEPMLIPALTLHQLGVSDQFMAGELTARQTAKACLATASELDAGGHSREAILLYEKARYNDPSLKQLAHRLAVLYDRDGQAGKAAEEFQLALEHAGKDSTVWSDYGFFQLKQGNLEAAEAALQSALELNPNDLRATMNLAMLYAQTRRELESLQLFADTVGEAAAHSNLGVILAKQGRTEEAKEHFDRAIELDSELVQPKAFLTHFARIDPEPNIDSDLDDR